VDNDADGAIDCADVDCQSPGGDCKPAPALDRSVATTVADSSAFLYTGDNPLQKGADAKAFERARVAVLHGRVMDTDGAPLPGVSVSVQGHPEYGYTLTRGEGQYDLVVNGGSRLLLEFSADGFLAAQRSVSPKWQQHARVDDLGLVDAVGKTSSISADAEDSQAISGPASDDAFGVREPFLVFEPGTTAEALLPNGTRHALSTLSVTVTEYPIASGESFLPGTASNIVGVSYALEFEVAEAKRLGASHVEFSEPVSLYVENFLDLPVGTTLPMASYDRVNGQWERGTTGHVIQLLSVAGGTVQVDSDGDGLADDAATLEAIGITPSDLSRLAERYPAGTELWHGSVTHFSTQRAQVKVKAPAGATQPKGDGIDRGALDTPSRSGPALVEPQALWQSIPVTGTPYSLEYLSNRSMAYGAGYQHEFPLTPSVLPAGLKRVSGKLEIAGRTFSASYDAAPLNKFVVAWDGKDGFGRLLQGPQPAQLTISYTYDGQLLNGKKSGKPIDVTLSQKFELKLGLWDAKGMGLGGFAFDVLHAYDPAQHTIYFGNGDQRSAENVALVTAPACTDASFNLGTPDSIFVGSDGSLIVTDDQQQSKTAPGRVLRVAQSGKATVVVGTGAAGSAGKLTLAQPQGVVTLDDGSIVVADLLKKAVRRIDSAGVMTTLVGSEASDKPVVSFVLTHPDGLALGPREELYVVDSDRVLLYEAGKIVTVAGGGTETADGGLATNALLSKPSGVAVASDGTLFISDRDGHRVRKVNLDGTISTIAGIGTAGFSGDGGNGLTAQLNGPRGLAVGPDGSVYVVDQGNARIRRISPDGLIQTVIGGGKNPITDGRLATDVSLLKDANDITTGPDGIAMGPDGALYVAAMNTVFRVSPALPQLNEKDNLIPSADGRVLYHFDHRGRHLETIDAMTGVAELVFAYDSFGHLQGIIDKNDHVTTIERSGDGSLAGIVAPYGQRTGITLSVDGSIAKVTDPLARSVVLAWNSTTGTLDSTNSPWSEPSTFQYDPMGRLLDVKDPAGKSKLKLTPSVTNNGFLSVSVSVRDGQPTEYLSRFTTANVWERSIKQADGSHLDWSELGTSVPMVFADGTKSMTYLVPDIAFGPQSMVPSESTTTLPSGKSLTSYSLRSKRVSDIHNALSLEEWRDEVEVNGRVYATEYHRNDRTLTTTSPMGRLSTLKLDEMGRPLLMAASGMPTVSWTYDDDYRIATVTKTAGVLSRTEARSYSKDGWLSSRANPLNERVGYSWDVVGRPTVVTRPDQRTIAWSFDNADNVTGLTTPSNFSHAFAYDASTNLLIGLTPPVVDQTPANGIAPGGEVYGYGPHQEIVSVTRSDGATIQFGYDAIQRLTSQSFGKVAVTYGYDAGGALTTINRSDSVKVETTHDGPLWTGTTWSGAVTGNVKATYDDNFWLKTLTVNDSSSVSFTYDDDGLVIAASSAAANMTIARAVDSGLVTGTTLGTVATAQSNNGFAEPSTLSASIGGAALFSQTLERDALGRVTHIVENSQGSAHDSTYGYDSVGRLVRVVRDGLVTTYAYDANGNRISMQSGTDAPVVGAYDSQDRIKTYGALAYDHTPHGDLLVRSDGDKTLLLTYDELGNLASATVSLPTKTDTIDYVVDGLGRRVARKVNGAFDRAWLYRDELRPIAEIDSAGTFTHFVYADSVLGAPDFMIRSGVPYRIVKDHVGSVRLVVNAQSGAIAQSIDYDVFGRVLANSAPGFQPFGFAGGLYDAATGLVRFGARDYEPDTGRWTNKDPTGFAGGDTNVYAYCGGDPVNAVDPDGEHPVALAVAAAAGVLLATSDREATIAAVSGVAGALVGPVLGYFARLVRPVTNGTLSAAERAALQEIANEFDTEIHVVGSRAAGRGRAVGSRLPPGRGPGTRSDIDVRIDTDVEIRTGGALSDALKEMGPTGLVDVRPLIGTPRPPVITFTPIRRSIWFEE
jgi:RHS repeat-associated protein